MAKSERLWAFVLNAARMSSVERMHTVAWDMQRGAILDAPLHSAQEIFRPAKLELCFRKVKHKNYLALSLVQGAVLVLLLCCLKAR